MFKKREWKDNAIVILLGGFILSFISLYNGYPLVYSDTGTYIYSGFDMFVPNDRPITYGMFLKFFSFKTSAWLVVIAQNLLTSYFLFKFIEIWEFNKRKQSVVFLVTITVLTFITSIGWYSNLLMPDFFTPLVIIGSLIILFSPKLTKVALVFVSIATVYGIICHFSHLLIFSSLVAIFLLIGYFNKFKLFSLKKIIVLISITIVSWLSLPSINYLVEGRFISSKGSHVFLMSHLCGTGILKDFLNENCETDEYKDCKICEFKDDLPNDPATFIWSRNIVQKCGGWEGSKEEFDKIIKGTITDFDYLSLNVFRSITYGLSQLTRNKVGEGLTAYPEHSAPYGQINWRFKNELNDYLMSKQNAFGGIDLKHDKINEYQNILLLLTIIGLLFLFYKKEFFPVKLKLVIGIVLAGILINSMFTAGLNTSYSRYQSRVVWLFPVVIWITYSKFFWELFKELKAKFLNK